MTRRLLALAACALFLLPALAGEKTYGEGVSGSETIKISELMDNPDDYVGETVRVEGMVIGVCEKRGCWMELAGDEEFKSVRVKVEHGVISFPVEAKGKHAIAEGVFTRIDLTREQALAQARHHAEEHGEELDESKVKAHTVYLIRGTGAVIES
jgi:hypothetical protein